MSSFVSDLLTSNNIIFSFIAGSDLHGPYGKFLYIIEDFLVSCHILCGLSMLSLYSWCRNVGDPPLLVLRGSWEAGQWNV